MTFHPETIGIEENSKLFDEVLKSLSIFKSMQIIFTYPNADLQSSSILRRLEGFVEKNEIVTPLNH